tara:strand:+ start:4985 stop:5557 length:573 start_codon:yes stop_codon:yes gene_type:complete
MGVEIHKARGDDPVGGIDHPLSDTISPSSDLGYNPVLYPEVTLKSGNPCPVNDRPPRDMDVIVGHFAPQLIPPSNIKRRRQPLDSVIICKHWCVVSKGNREPRNFSDAVASVLAGLTEGEVLSYGEVAEEAGFPGGARAVGQFLKRNPGYPWWRIVNANGRLAPGNEVAQANLLRSEGVLVKNGHVVAMR